jgi:hypothetical protein
VRAIEAARDEFGPPPAELAEDVSAETVFDAEQSRSPRARNADALVALAQTALAERASSADVYQVVVHVDAEAFGVSAETARRCELEDGEPLSRSAVRRLTCDASIVSVLERGGKPLAVGRETRAIPPALQRALRLRDNCCAFPGCNQRYHLECHHIEHWADGGRTEGREPRAALPPPSPLAARGWIQDRQGRRRTHLRLAEGRVIPQAPRLPRGDCTT